MKYIYQLAMFIIWVSGVVIAKGFWSTFFAIFTAGLWSTYLVVEKLLQFNGII